MKITLELNEYIKMVNQLGFAKGALEAIGWRLENATNKTFAAEMRNEVREVASLATKISKDFTDPPTPGYVNGTPSASSADEAEPARSAES